MPQHLPDERENFQSKWMKMFSYSPWINFPPFPASAANIQVGIVAGAAAALRRLFRPSGLGVAMDYFNGMPFILGSIFGFETTEFWHPSLCCLKQHHTREKKLAKFEFVVSSAVQTNP